jgi:hypothetical protein
MRIHTNRFHALDIYAAANFTAGATVECVREHGSRTRLRAFDFYITGDSPYRHAFGKDTIGAYAASWDQWGLMLGQLFSIDPAAHTGRYGYRSSNDFHYKTGHRFVPGFLRPSDTHRRHKWNRSYDYQAICECGAVNRWGKGAECSHEPIVPLPPSPADMPTADWVAHMAARYPERMVSA